MLPVPARLTGGSWAFFLDVDGTLLDIADAPDLVHVEQRLLTLLDAVRRASGGAVALVSGRSLADLDRLFSPLCLPAAGLHGAERRDAAGQTRHSQPDPWLAGAAARLRDWAGQHPGSLVEDKGGAVALHFRLAPGAEAEARAEVDRLLSGAAGRYVLQRGKCVLEIKPAGANKARAIAEFMTEPPFAGRRPVFVGDDVTDEDGFQAVRDMDGVAVVVDGRVPTHAQYRLGGVSEVQDWLAAWLADQQGETR